MARVGDFCIDTTEVTNAQYVPFLQAVTANPRMAEQPADVCSWNTDFQVASGYPKPADGDPNDPVRGVDWCDAYAFCRWANKRLCGAVGGGSSPYSNFAQPTDQWYFACSSNGRYAYTYGAGFDEKACNGDGTGRADASVVNVAQSTRCHPPASPFASLYDMTGNVLEWEDSCESSAVDSDCLTRGGWFKSPEPAALACNKNGRRKRTASAEGVGIRCCSP
ncbi:formylglycine-generating enzyme family protein [Pendulispora albinea]|uniref:Formylglycine-generating enzyme family protein n=1 Tax=Pendulispora albinea TaxID=2741071 RepID=A0ABZ2M208_9BACT